MGRTGKLKILLLGDSTTIGSVCRQADPDGPHLEDVIRLLLAAEKDLPPAEVINQGRDGEFIRGLLSSGRYDKEIAPLGGVDYVLIRYGLNDIGKREEFEVNFPKDYAELIGRLRRDFPRATIVPMTIIPYMTPERDESINALIRKVAESERLTLFDVYTRYRAELMHGPDMLNYRRYPLEKIPERHREWVKPFVRGGQVVVMDNRLDAHFRELARLVRRSPPQSGRLSRDRRRVGQVPRETDPGKENHRGRRQRPAARRRSWGRGWSSSTRASRTHRRSGTRPHPTARSWSTSSTTTSGPRRTARRATSTSGSTPGPAPRSPWSSGTWTMSGTAGRRRSRTS